MNRAQRRAHPILWAIVAALLVALFGAVLVERLHLFDRVGG